jgi:hypothetical protein
MTVRPFCRTSVKSGIDTDELISTVRTAADNLLNAFDVSLQGIIDLQIHELVSPHHMALDLCNTILA